MAAEELTLVEQQTALVELYLAARAAASADPKGRRELSRLERKLDEFYWRRVEELVSDRVDPNHERLEFSREERLLIDFGLLDLSLVEGAGADLPQRLAAELDLPGGTNHYYLSEWLEDRYHRHQLTREVTRQESDRSADDQFSQARLKVLERLRPCFQGLPGVPAEVASQLVSGAFDDKLLALSVSLLAQSTPKAYRHRRRLWLLRAQVFEKARARATDQTALKLFDVVDELYQRDWRERVKVFKEAKQAARAGGPVRPAMTAADRETREKLVGHLLTELRVIRNQLPVGALAGGVTRTCAALLKDEPRVTKADTNFGLNLAQCCDRGFTVNPVVLIAPFTGRGIFEWDHDSLVVSLQPVANALDSVANAAGNYRMLIDSFQSDGALRTAYEAEFSGANFQQTFQADYRAWVCGVGQGKREALDPKHLEFFRREVGPDCSAPLAPANLRKVGPATRQSLIKRLQKEIDGGTADANLHQRLSVLLWQEERPAEALAAMAQAARLAPQAGDILLNLGLILRAQGQAEKAAGIFRACAARVPGTIYAVYAAAAAAGEW